MSKSIAIVGYGKVGSALGTFLTKCGYDLIGYSRTDVSSEKVNIKVSEKPHEITSVADIVFITTPDGVIQEVTEEISDKGGFKKGSVVLHCSGAQPSTILKSARKSGASIGSVHPLQSIASRTFKENPFKGAIFAVEGDEEAIIQSEKIAKVLDGISFIIKTESKTLYHAAAVVASNYLVSLIDFSVGLLESSGIPRGDCYSVIEPLVKGTLRNIKEKGTIDALTGPVVRGDEQTIANHITALTRDRKDLLELYKKLGLYTVKIAGNTLDNRKISILEDLFK